MEKERPKKIAKAMNIVWASLESHLLIPYIDKKYSDKDIKFHQQCVREYAELIKLLSELY